MFLPLLPTWQDTAAGHVGARSARRGEMSFVPPPLCSCARDPRSSPLTAPTLLTPLSLSRRRRRLSSPLRRRRRLSCPASPSATAAFGSCHGDRNSIPPRLRERYVSLFPHGHLQRLGLGFAGSQVLRLLISCFSVQACDVIGRHIPWPQWILVIALPGEFLSSTR